MRTKKGIVTAAKMMNTVTVVEHRAVFHPIYKKRFRRSKKFMADSEGIEDLQEGDTVIISECKPLSKRKYFKVMEVVERVPRVSEFKEDEGIEEAVHGKKEETDETESGIRNQESVKDGEAKPDSGFRIPVADRPRRDGPDSETQDSSSTSDKPAS
ncbi:30S ribosomal protein S17 [Patescibacteria group bacterium]|nr:30S ribosomal protein S17 [Patescibacteria group bacterium]MBU2259736.1 30S ribosomal protein S17 [Patescibacteria group bacterium]